MATIDARAVELPPALEASTLCDAFSITVAERPDQPAVRSSDGRLELTFAELDRHARGFAAQLAELGVAHGDTVGIMLVNRPEFFVADLAAMHRGAIPFSIYNTSTPDQIRYLFGNAGNRVVVTEEAFLPAIQGAGFDGEVIMAEDVLGHEGDGYDVGSVRPDDELTLIYTSGTTGPPKGVQLTHRNLLTVIRGTCALSPVTPGGRIVSFLPAAHIADRWGSYYQALCGLGFTVTTVSDPRQVIAALPEVHPTVWGAVPRIWEKLKAALEANGLTDPAAAPPEMRAAVLGKLGLDAVEQNVVGAAPTPIEVLEFFDALGLPIQEVWGMSETSAVSTINPKGDVRFGTCGVAIPGCELKLADDGELLVRGDHVMTGYRGEPEKTAEALDADGWLRTGDIAQIDADGYLKIVDRKKELIINAAGKNMSPANIEARLKASSPVIGQAVAIGDARPYNVALIVLDPDVRAGRPADDPELVAAVEAGVAAANEQLSRVEQIKRYRVLDEDWLPGGDELTPTMKLKRKPIAAKYAAVIEELYA
jgi:long-chain acyl-CoA synthetase